MRLATDLRTPQSLAKLPPVPIRCPEKQMGALQNTIRQAEAPLKSLANVGSGLSGAVIVALVVALGWPSTALADGPTMSGKVTGVSVRFQPANHPQLPSAATISAMTVELMRDGENLYAAADAPAGARPESLAISRLGGFQLSAAAVDQVQQRVIKFINRTGVGAVACRFETPATGGSGAAVVNVVAGTVADVRGRSDGAADAQTPTAARIVAESPIQGAAATAAPAKDDEKDAAAPAKDDSSKQLLNTADIDGYLARLNRFPGRSVAATISAGDDPATLVLDYLVAEEKTFSVFAEVSNFGTESTSKWLERFGAYITQLTNNDDILSIDVLTGNFQDTTNSINGYYDARVGNSKEFRWRVTGNYSDYTAADVGFPQQNFTGTSWGAQGDLIWNCYQSGSLFVDIDLGFRYWSATTQNTFFGFVLSDATSNFITPTVSVNLFDMTPNSSVQASLGFDYTDPSADQLTLDELGRLNTSESWATIFGSASWSTYLDQWFAPSRDKVATKLPIHELTMRGSGQWAFNYRLTPLAMSTMGGYYTVRGYPQSAIAGDSAAVGSVEYRLHLPRAFESAPPGPGPDGKPFRWAPDANTGAGPDWDLALVGFVDAGAVWQNQALSYEENATLIGAGVGVECSVRQNLKLIAEYGWALKALESDNVAAGNGQFYFLARLTF